MIRINGSAIPSFARQQMGGGNKFQGVSSHAHCRHGLSRRQFLKTGAAMIGAATVSGMLGSSVMANGPGNGIPTQLPGFSPLIFADTGLEVPFFLPIEIDPFAPAYGDQDSSTITDFNGFIGVIEADGVSNNNSEGVDRRWACDVRFMKGVFRDRDGRTKQGAFGFF